MTWVTVGIGVFFIFYGVAMLLRPSLFTSRGGRTPPPALGAGMAVVGAGIAVSTVQDQLALALLSLVLALAGIALIVAGIVKLRQKHE